MAFRLKPIAGIRRISAAGAAVFLMLSPALADVSAIAIGKRSSQADDFAAGWATAASTEEAISQAVEFCKKDGGINCQVLGRMTFQNCAAVAVDDGDNAKMNIERTRREAEEAALRSCGNSSCHTVISHCH